MKKIFLLILLINFSFAWESFKITTPLHQTDKSSKYDSTRPNDNWINYSVDVDEQINDETDPFLKQYKKH